MDKHLSWSVRGPGSPRRLGERGTWLAPQGRRLLRTSSSGSPASLAGGRRATWVSYVRHDEQNEANETPPPGPSRATLPVGAVAMHCLSRRKRHLARTARQGTDDRGLAFQTPMKTDQREEGPGHACWGRPRRGPGSPEARPVQASMRLAGPWPSAWPPGALPQVNKSVGAESKMEEGSSLPAGLLRDSVRRVQGLTRQLRPLALSLGARSASLPCPVPGRACGCGVRLRRRGLPPPGAHSAVRTSRRGGQQEALRTGSTGKGQAAARRGPPEAGPQGRRGGRRTLWGACPRGGG